ncbi:extensin [Drosophila busckii]|uniref:extensin n=1 Tax=Drosophila busckii TaxID=30019 RepID=UPI00083EF85A|nr:extensin [Drosophila busckii]
MQLLLKLSLTLALATTLVQAFGNEYVHIKVHVPKEQAPAIAIDAEPHPPQKVIHHFHHHAPPPPPHGRGRGRGPPPPAKLKTSPLLESVILSDLDKPLHMSEHADYLNHAKELAEHLSETYVVKKPPAPPKKKVNTYTIIEEKQPPRHHGYDYEPHSHADAPVDTYRVQHYPRKHAPIHVTGPDDDDEDIGYPPASHHTHSHHKPPSNSYLAPEPAPVEELSEVDAGGYSYNPPAYAKSSHTPAHTLEAPDEQTHYGYEYSNNGFRPSPQLHNSRASSNYEDDIDAYAAPLPSSRRRRPNAVDWSPGHAQASSSGHSTGYHYPGPYL